MVSVTKEGRPVPWSVPPVPLAPETARAVRHTLWGITCLGAAFGIIAAGLLFFALIPGLSLGPWPLLAVLGWVFLVWNPAVFGRAQRWLAWTALAVAFLAVLVWAADPYAFGGLPSANDLNALAAAYRTQVLFAALFGLLASVSIFCSTFAVQDRLGRALLVAGLVAALVVQALVWQQLNALISRDLAALVPSPSSPSPLQGFPTDWARIGWLSAVPLLVDLVAFERLYWKLRQHFMPRESLLSV